MSSTQSTKARSECFSLPGHKSDHGTKLGIDPEAARVIQTQGNGWMLNAPMDFGDPWSKAVSAASHKAYG